MPQPLANIRFGATIAAATAALALTPVIAVASASAKTARATGTTIHVVEHAITDTEVGTDAKGAILTFNNPVFDSADRTQVGHDEGFCVRLQVKLGIWECLWTTFLKGGQITVQGPFYDTRNSELSITGGTGRYRRARGQMDLKSRNGGKEYDFIFHLS